MKAVRLGLIVLLADFVGLTGYAVWYHGYGAFFALPFQNAVTGQVAIDLVIALSMVVVWMWGDARRRGLSPLPYTLITLCLGSIGPLLYLIRITGAETAPRAARVHTAAA